MPPRDHQQFASTASQAELSTLRTRKPADTLDPLLQAGALPALSSDGDGSPLLLRGAAASRVPLLLTRGAADVSSVAVARRVASSVPSARLVQLDGVTSSLGHVEARAAYNTALLDFLDEVDGVRSRRAIMLPGSMAPGGSVKGG